MQSFFCVNISAHKFMKAGLGIKGPGKSCVKQQIKLILSASLSSFLQRGCSRIKKWPIVVCPIRFHNFKQ